VLGAVLLLALVLAGLLVWWCCKRRKKQSQEKTNSKVFGTDKLQQRKRNNSLSDLPSTDSNDSPLAVQVAACCSQRDCSMLHNQSAGAAAAPLQIVCQM
jgi:hypothetical protein